MTNPSTRNAEAPRENVTWPPEAPCAAGVPNDAPNFAEPALALVAADVVVVVAPPLVVWLPYKATEQPQNARQNGITVKARIAQFPVAACPPTPTASRLAGHRAFSP